jgi:phosphate transport system permease protein
MFLVLFLFVIARLIGGRGPGQLSAGQRRRIARQSKHDLERIEGRAHTPSSVTLDSAGATA